MNSCCLQGPHYGGPIFSSAIHLKQIKFYSYKFHTKVSFIFQKATTAVCEKNQCEKIDCFVVNKKIV